MTEMEYTRYADRLEQEDGYNISELIKLIVIRAKMITVVTLSITLLVFLVSQFVIIPRYEASVSMYVNNTKDSMTQTTDISDLNASQRLVNTYIEIVKSNTVMDKVARNSGLDYTADQLKSMISTKAVSNTEIFHVTVRSKNPEHAAKLANQIAKDAPDEIMSFVEATSVKIIDYAKVPTKPATPDVRMNTGIGLILGFAFSIMLVFLIEMLDVRIRSEEEIPLLVELPVLGVIPRVEADLKSNYATGGYYDF